MVTPGLKEMAAASRQQDNERRIAAAELRRQAKAARHTAESSDRAVAVELPAFGSVAGAWHWLGRGIAGVVMRRATA